jgi:Spy/CpxP family protein refolding chaperone
MNSIILVAIRTSLGALLFGAVLCVAALQARAQGDDDDGPPSPPPGARIEPQDGPPDEAANPFRLLNLSPEQVEKIRAIRMQSDPEARALTRRMNIARRALDRALYDDDAEEPLVRQRAQELADAQSAVTRLRANVEWRIRSVLTPSQLSTLRELRARAQLRRLEERRGRRNRQGRPDNAFGPPQATPDGDNSPPRLPRPRRPGLFRRQP